MSPLPPGLWLWLKCNRLLRLGRPVGVENDGEMRGESEVPGGALNLSSTNYPDHGHHGCLPLSRKNAHGIEPGTSWLVARSSDYPATRLVRILRYKILWKYIQWESSYTTRTDVTNLTEVFRNSAKASRGLIISEWNKHSIQLDKLHFKPKKVSENCWGLVTIRIINLQYGIQLNTRVGTLIVATIYLQLIQNRYMFRSFTVLHCSHQHCVQLVASDVEVVGYL